MTGQLRFILVLLAISLVGSSSVVWLREHGVTPPSARARHLGDNGAIPSSRDLPGSVLRERTLNLSAHFQPSRAAPGT